MTNAWDNLPNAKHIYAVLAHFEQHPDKWDAARGAAGYAAGSAARITAQDAAWLSAHQAARGAAMDAARSAAMDAAGSAAWNAARATYDARIAARGACYALIAWDDAGDLLAMPVDAVRLLAACNHHPAVLLLPAVVAMEK